MAKLYQYYSEQTLANVDTINTSHCEKSREQAILAIVESQQKDKARLFIELFQYSAWRQTQGALLSAIGATKELRGVEFLIRFIRQSKDLPLAAKATLGLGFSQTSLAGEFLLSVLKKQDSRLRLEALKGLALMPQFHCDEQLTDIIKDEDAQDDLRLHAIIAAGRRGAKQSTPSIIELLKSENAELRQAALLASGHLLASVDQLKTVVYESSNLMFQEIKDYIEDRIYQRSKINVDDLIISSMSEDGVDWQSSFRLLREAPATEVRKALTILEDNIDSKVACLIRAAAYDKLCSQDDIAFLLKHEKDLGHSEAAILARLCINQNGPEFIKQLAPAVACDLLNQVRVADILAFADDFFIPSENPRLSIAFINAVVAQCYMSWKVNSACVLFLKAQLVVTEDSAVLNRLVRALAQLNCTESDYLDKLSADLEKPAQEASISYCLSLLPSTYAAPILLAHLEKAYDANKPIDDILERVSLLGVIDGLTELPVLDEQTQTRCALPLLRILSFNQLTGFDGFLETQLSFGNHAKQLLAIRAIGLNGQHWHCDLLFSFLNSENEALQIRALNSLCQRGSANHHLKLLNWFITDAFETETATLIFNKLHPKAGEDYSQVINVIEKLIRERVGPFVDDEILAAALSLYDNIALLTPKGNDGELPATLSRHAQDDSLAREINGYADYSETIKIVLRNAELTWQHTELFNHVVDKSTMLVQYSKSTDLLLQQRIGLPVFQNADDAFLTDLQTRVMELGLDKATFSQAKMIRFLNLEGFFTTREFPAHKLKTLTDAIMSGKIMADRFRSIDGLRAWSLILLLYARTFVINKTKYSPLIPMKKSGEEKINSIVKLMNKFQDLRNSAAHHGVLVEPKLLAEIRSDSFALLNELEEVLAKPN